jgi:hypothetical protein
LFAAPEQHDVVKDNVEQSPSVVSLSKDSDSSSETAVAHEPLEAHPGSPIDLSGRRRPSLAAAMAAHQASLNAHAKDFAQPKEGIETRIKRDGVVAKSQCNCEYVDVKTGPRTRVQTAATQPFFVPAKVPEQLEVHSLPSPSDDGMSLDGSMDSALDFDFQEENGVWISAIPRAHESHTSFSSCNTLHNSLGDIRSVHSSLTVDTSLASSEASILSSSASVMSGTTNCSDIYGWEEELDRKSSMESCASHAREAAQRRLHTGGRTQGYNMRNEALMTRQLVGKRKSLLHRVLNISRRDLNEPVPTTRMRTCSTSMN